MLKIITIIILSGVFINANAAIYQWTDAQGVQHFADDPVTGAQIVRLAPPAIYAAQTPAVTMPDNNTADVLPYQRLFFTQPAERSTVWNTQQITVQLIVQPALRINDRIQLLVDGKTYGAAQTAMQWRLENLPRGEHQLQAKIVDTKDEVLKMTPPLIFYLQQSRVKNA